METLNWINKGIELNLIDSHIFSNLDISLTDKEVEHFANLLFKKELITDIPDANYFCPSLVNELNYANKTLLFSTIKGTCLESQYKINL